MSTASEALLSAFKTELFKPGVADTVNADLDRLNTHAMDLYLCNPSVADIAYKDPFNIDHVHSALCFVGLAAASAEFTFSALGDDPDALIGKALQVLPLNANGAAPLDGSSKCIHFLSSDEDNLHIARLASLWGVHELTAFHVIVLFAVLCNTLGFRDLEYYIASMTWAFWFEASRVFEDGAVPGEIAERFAAARERFCETGVLDDITRVKLSLLMLMC